MRRTHPGVRLRALRFPTSDEPIPILLALFAPPQLWTCGVGEESSERIEQHRSGIELSEVRTLAHAHAGRCRVERGRHGGARFVIELPRVRTASPGQVDSGDVAHPTDVTGAA